MMLRVVQSRIFLTTRIRQPSILPKTIAPERSAWTHPLHLSFGFRQNGTIWSDGAGQRSFSSVTKGRGSKTPRRAGDVEDLKILPRAKPVLTASYFSPDPRLIAVGGNRDWRGRLVDIQLSLDEWGDPDGYPVMYMHSQPGSRVEGALLHDIATRYGLRIICVDRPGMGLSEDSIYRSLLEWPLQLRFVAKALGLKDFGVVSFSGGAPSALACAYVLPDLVKFVHCWAPTMPYDKMPWGIKKQLDGTDLAYSYLARIWRYFLFRTFSREAERTTGSASADELFEDVLGLPHADQEILQRKDVAAVLKDARMEVFRCGSKGAAVDAALVYQDWGFQVSELPKYIPIRLFHGEEDSIIPPSVAEWLDSNIEHAKLTLLKDQGHFFCFGRESAAELFHAIVQDAEVHTLTPDSAAAPPSSAVAARDRAASPRAPSRRPQQNPGRRKRRSSRRRSR